MSRSRLSIFFLATLLLLAGSFGCGPPASQGGEGSQASGSGGLPELTDELVRERINYAWVGNIPPESGNGDPMGWSFDEDEPKEIVVVDRQMNGTKATLVLDIKTKSSPRSRNPRELAGQIRTEWELRTGWALRRWEIVDAENISMKYKKLPTPTPPPLPNENRQP